MKNILYQVNNFLLIERLDSNAIKLPPQFASSKENLEKIGVYKASRSNIFQLNLLNRELTDAEGEFLVYVDNFSVLTVEKFNTERMFVPKSSIILVEFVPKYQDED